MPRATGVSVEIEYESFGSADDPTLILVHGSGTQMLTFEEDLCLGFRDRGFHVIRMDNRDSGLSTILPEGTEYTFGDMAADVIAVLDDATIDRAIVLGFSLGGMIAQTVAIEHPERVAGLVSVGSTTGEPDVGQPTDEAIEALLRPPAATVTEQIERDLEGYRIWSNPEWRDEVWRRAFLESAYARAWHPGAAARHHAVYRSGDRVDGLRRLTVPSLVVHGDHDPLVGVSGGRRTAELIPDAEYLEIEGMAHVLAPQIWPQLISAVTALAARID